MNSIIVAGWVMLAGSLIVGLAAIRSWRSGDQKELWRVTIMLASSVGIILSDKLSATGQLLFYAACLTLIAMWRIRIARRERQLTGRRP